MKGAGEFKAHLAGPSTIGMACINESLDSPKLIVGHSTGEIKVGRDQIYIVSLCPI